MKSVFGAYADNLQVMVDASKERFSTPWFPKYFDFGVPQPVLTYVHAIGRSRVDAAASIVDRDARTPLRSRPGLEKLSGEIPAIKEMFKMTDNDYRNYLMLQNMQVSDSVKRNQILDLMFNDTQKVGDASMKRVDYMVLEALSTGQITVTTTNNPDGIVASTPIDLLMPSGNKKNSTKRWGTPSTAKPITDINAAVTAAQGEWKVFAKMLMSRTTFLKMAAAEETRNVVSGFFRINSKDQITPTLNQINEYLTANLLPQVELVDEVVGVEKDGAITAYRPFADDKVSFIPNGKLGIIHNAIAIEKLAPVSGVAYADYNRALISKWSENEPFGEYTKVELNAFPGVDTIDSIYILDTTQGG